MTRSKDLREKLSWPQDRLGEFLGLTQPSVARLEKGLPETGPVSRLLDQLQCAIEVGLVTAGMGPEEVVAAIELRLAGSAEDASTSAAPSPFTAEPAQ